MLGSFPFEIVGLGGEIRDRVGRNCWGARLQRELLS
jgi:hypothetical protein